MADRRSYALDVSASSREIADRKMLPCVANEPAAIWLIHPCKRCTTVAARHLRTRGTSVAIPRVTMMTLLIVLLLLALLGGGFGYSRFGAAGLGPAGLIILVLIILALTGRL